MQKYNNTPTEDVEQVQLFTWAQYMSGKYPELELMYHIPNGGKRSKAEAGRFKAMGVKSGVPDIFIPCARGGYFGCYIEMKRAKGGTVSANQKKWIEALKEQGYFVVVAYGMEQAAKYIEEYMKKSKTKEKFIC